MPYLSNVTCIGGYFITSLILAACAGYVYRVNSKRSADDPAKKNYHPNAVWLSLVWPLLAVGWVIMTAIRALLYGLFLVLFTVLLLAVRKPFLIEWLEKAATFIGVRLLKMNSFLIKLLTLPFRLQRTF